MSISIISLFKMSDAATHSMPYACQSQVAESQSGQKAQVGVGDMHNCEGKRERNTCYQRLRAGAGEGASAQAWV